MQLLNKDLNLLLVFSVIWEERSLSKAAARLYLSQSAVSHSLKRLRAEFGDSLFVRNSKGVAPTDFAATLAPQIRDFLRSVEDLYSSNAAFDPRKAERKLVLAAGDYFSITMLEQFVARLGAEAPKVRLTLQPVAAVFQLEKFEKGEIHLAITAIDVTAKEGFHTKEIYQDKIAICVRKGHPMGKVTPEKYLLQKHLNVSNYGSERGVIDEFLEPKGLKRNVALVASSFFDAGRLLRHTDFVLTAPQEICRGLAEDYGLQVLTLPFDYKIRSISMIWHERTNQDPFYAWVRNLLLSEGPAGKKKLR